MKRNASLSLTLFLEHLIASSNLFSWVVNLRFIFFLMCCLVYILALYKLHAARVLQKKLTGKMTNRFFFEKIRLFCQFSRAAQNLFFYFTTGDNLGMPNKWKWKKIVIISIQDVISWKLKSWSFSGDLKSKPVNL